MPNPSTTACLFGEPSRADRSANILAAARALATFLARSRTLDRRLVAGVMTTAFGASDAEGAWRWRDACDAIEAATVMQVRRLAPQVSCLEDAPAEIAAPLSGVSALGRRQPALHHQPRWSIRSEWIAGGWRSSGGAQTGTLSSPWVAS